MNDSGPPGRDALVVGMMAGKLHDFREVGLPFQQDVIPALEDVGITNEDGGTVEARYPNLPPSLPPPQGPQTRSS